MPNYTPPQHAKPLDLRSPFLKVKWAKDHIANLSGRRVRFLGGHKYSGVPEYDAKTNRTQFVLQGVPDMDPCISLLVGDIAHNLRTALDHLACETLRSVG